MHDDEADAGLGDAADSTAIAKQSHERHMAFLKRKATGTQSFRPKKIPRLAAKKMLRMLDNQVSWTYPGGLCPPRVLAPSVGEQCEDLSSSGQRFFKKSRCPLEDKSSNCSPTLGASTCSR